MTALSAPGWEETLRDGRVVALRPLRGDDTAGVEALWRRLDAPTRRLFTQLAHLPPDRPGEVAVPRPGHTGSSPSRQTRRDGSSGWRGMSARPQTRPGPWCLSAPAVVADVRVRLTG